MKRNVEEREEGHGTREAGSGTWNKENGKRKFADWKKLAERKSGGGKMQN